MELSLYSGLSGLLVNQLYLDVIGDNLANSNTVGFKTRRMTFSDVLAETLAPGSAPSGSLGGANPVEVGRGVRPHSIDPIESQGVFLDTGRDLDMAIDGRGFFALTDGSKRLYTRAGVFGLDSQSSLVDTGTGLKVLGADGQPIVLSLTDPFPPKATGTVTMQGNLPAKITGPTTELVSSGSPFKSGTQATLVGANAEPFDLDDGTSQPMKLNVRVDRGSSREVTFTLSEFADPNAATAQEVADVLNTQVPELEALAQGGAVVVRSRTTGETSSLDLEDGRGNPAAIIGLSTDEVRGSESVAVATSDLSSLTLNDRDYASGDAIQIAGTDANGAAISVRFVYGTDGTTVGDLVGFIDASFAGAHATLQPDGNVLLEADQAGEASLSLKLEDDAQNTGATRFDEDPFAVTTEGAGPDTATSAIDIYDAQGRLHVLTLTLTRRNGSTWDLSATVPTGEGTVIAGNVNGIQFNADGSYAGLQVGGTAAIAVDFGAGVQSVALDLGQNGTLNGLTQLGELTTAQATDQDGYAPGDLVAIHVQEDGFIAGTYTNGQTQNLAQLGVAEFTNSAALARAGKNYFTISPDSGDVVLGAPAAGGASIVGGSLESSNVELSGEFVHMIEAQRSYQANARVIQASDQMLAEAVNLTR
ncbi:MAG: flagellar hook-basal body complex protein [Planctomycetota bacterium]